MARPIWYSVSRCARFSITTLSAMPSGPPLVGSSVAGAGALEGSERVSASALETRACSMAGEAREAGGDCARDSFVVSRGQQFDEPRDCPSLPTTTTYLPSIGWQLKDFFRVVERIFPIKICCFAALSAGSPVPRSLVTQRGAPYYL